MSKKQKSKTDFENIDNVKKLILVNEQVHSNWMSGLPLVEGNEHYAKSNPEDWARLMNAYKKINTALDNPPLNDGTDSGCCGGGCGCHV